MFKLTLVASMLALAVAQYHGYGAPAAYGGHDLAQPTPYQYGFDIVGGDAHSGDFRQSRQEHSDGHGNVQGSYSYSDAHGNHRVVDYVADGHGFRANVRTNEPGTESQSPADVQLHSDAGPAHVAGPVGHGPVGLGSVGLGHGVRGGHGLY